MWSSWQEMGIFRRVRKIPKATVVCIISDRLVVRLHGTTLLSQVGFSSNLLFKYFSVMCPETKFY